MSSTGSGSAGSTAGSRCRTSSTRRLGRRGSRWWSSSRSRIGWCRSTRRSRSRRRRPPGISRLAGFPIPRSSAKSEAVPSASEATAKDAAALLSAAAVRERCGIVAAAAEREETRHFRIVSARLDDAARRVVDVTRRRYPDLTVPYHSRWRHFSAGGIDRAALVAPGADAAERARARIDLAFVSVLLDAGAGSRWRYREAQTGQILSRS